MRIMWNLGVATVIIAPLALGFGGRLGLAWGLGWSWAAVLVWTVNRLPQSAWLIGLSAGGAIGVGWFGFASGFGSVLMAMIIWGVLGGIVGVQPGFARAGVTTVEKTVAGGLLVGVFGSLLAGLIGNLLLQVDLKVAGFVIGVVFLGPCWTIGMVGGLVLGSLVNRGKYGTRQNN